MFKRFIISFLLIATLGLTSCSSAVSQVPNPTNIPTETPGDVTPEVTTPSAGISESNMLEKISAQFGLDPALVKMVKMEPVQWPDGCMGVVKVGVMCAMVVIPGYRVTLEVNGLPVEFHTNLSGEVIKMAPSSEGLVLETLSSSTPCTAIMIKSGSVSSGTCGSELTAAGDLSQLRADQLNGWWRSRQPFIAVTPSGTIAFYGQGETIAAPSEERAMVEWTSLAAEEAQSGRSGAAWGLVLSWSRQGGIAGFCDDLAIYASGEVIQTSCRDTSAHPSAWLTADELTTLYAWMDQYQRGEIIQDDVAVADGMKTTLVFEGRGNAALTDEVKAAMLDFAARMNNEYSK